MSFRPVFEFIAGMGSFPGDSPEMRGKKRATVLNSLVIGLIFTGFLAPFYFHFHEPGGGWVYLSFGLFFLLGPVSLKVWPRLFPAFVFGALFLGVIVTVTGTSLLGGFFNSSCAPLWGWMASVRALVYYRPRKALYWIVVNLATAIFCLALQPWLRATNNVPEAGIVGLSLFILLATSGLSFFGLLFFMRQRDRAYRLFRDERRKSEKLLLNVLPREIAGALKNNPGTLADHYDEASVLFADVVDFTPLSGRLKPVQLVELLNEVFSDLDAMVEKHGLEKIKTIGDCYMVAAGVPRQRSDHAPALTRLALEIIQLAGKKEFGGGRLSFRIGINSGPVVAGVIGRKKFAYDLWGDVVNTASRMESHGLAGGIQVTEATYDLIKNEFACEDRGLIQVKGKGEVKTWNVTGVRAVA